MKAVKSLWRKFSNDHCVASADDWPALIFLEFYLPGAVLGIAGGILVVFSIVYFAFHASHPLWVLLFVLITLILLIALIRITLWRIRKAKPGHSIYLHKDQEGYVASSFQKELIGKRALPSQI